MSTCPCDRAELLELEIPAGLSALPRQLRAFPEIRRELLRYLPTKPALAEWRARGDRDLGLLLLDLWAYVGDVLGFYDERIANESYLRTAVRRPSVRKLVEMLGYVPSPGLAGAVRLAALADGRQEVTLPIPTGFRSEAFGDEPPQVFELFASQAIHPFKNQWRIGPLRRGVARVNWTNRLLFLPEGFALAKDRIVVVKGTPTLVTSVGRIQGQDGNSYIEVKLRDYVQLGYGARLEQISVSTPTVQAGVARGTVFGGDLTDSTLTGHAAYLDSVYRQLKKNDSVVIRVGDGLSLSASESVEDAAVVMPSVAAGAPVTRVSFLSTIPVGSVDNTTFHFSFVPTGKLADVADVELDRSELGRAEGLPLEGFVDRPPGIGPWGYVDQDFLILDTDEKGGLAPGRLQFTGDGRATLYITQTGQLPTGRYRLPLTVYGNLVWAGRGESVVDEELGVGEPRLENQRFKLQKKPLTYFEAPEKPGEVQSSLKITVAGIEWREVPSFFGQPPDAHVYTLRHDDEQESYVTFGDGKRGARLPSGAPVIANYRFGSGSLVPPAGSIKQLARPVDGLRGVRSPLQPQSGRDPDPPELMRELAPETALAMHRAVSVRDFEVLTKRFNGVVDAVAEWRWIEREQRAGVRLFFIGTAGPSDIHRMLARQAERGLPISVERARGWPFDLALDVEYRPGHEPEPIREAIRSALFDERDGLFALGRVGIGGVFWSSRLFEAVQAVDGVLAIRGAYLGGIDLAQRDSLCIGAGNYLDVKGSTAQIVMRRADEDTMAPEPRVKGDGE